ncbi:predicted protein [Postia placenta Mad-698-R]|uniref:Uncharacterized protein n=1 Tax=Postia placenta MAD-698-R-SB12 TaxID=670580 RepID=A0A1X6MRS1_9APHY|nr:hypothetical protein POSPLADRAFT_1173168 [Postia placenta MAD-698-R-SB12]EED82181.1 predicted protein [Postia placenta Mad-698-R]OSX58902.1 hypothetical protein POSPLADRAFT_1173168 [Postia placenta MAD-698-R-SB12]
MADMNSAMRSGVSVNLGLDESKWATGIRLSLPGPWMLAGVVTFFILSAIASVVLARLGLRRAFSLVQHMGLLSGTTSLSALGIICVLSVLRDSSVLVSLVWLGVHVSVSGTRGSGALKSWLGCLVLWAAVVSVGGVSAIGLVNASRHQSTQQRGLGRLVLWICGPTSVFWVNAMLQYYSWSRSAGCHWLASGTLDPWMHLAWSPSELVRPAQEWLWGQLYRVAGYSKDTSRTARTAIVRVITLVEAYGLVKLGVAGYMPLQRGVDDGDILRAVVVRHRDSREVYASSRCSPLEAILDSTGQSDDESDWDSDLDLWSSDSEDGSSDSDSDDDGFFTSRPRTPTLRVGWTYTSGTSTGVVSSEASGSGLTVVDKLDAVMCKSALDKTANKTNADVNDETSGAQADIAAIMADTQAMVLEELLRTVEGDVERGNFRLEELAAEAEEVSGQLEHALQATADAEECQTVSCREIEVTTVRLQDLEACISMLDGTGRDAEERFQREKAAVEALMDEVRRDAGVAAHGLESEVECVRAECEVKDQLAMSFKERIGQVAREDQDMLQHLQCERQLVEDEVKLVREEVAAKGCAMERKGVAVEQAQAEHAQIKHEYDAEVMERSGVVKQLEVEVGAKTSELKVGRGTLESIEEEIGTFKAHCSGLEQTQLQNQAEKETIEAALQVVKQEVEAKEYSLRELALEVSRVTRSCNELTERLDAEESSLELQRTKAHFAEETRKDKISQLEAKLAVSDATNEQLVADLTTEQVGLEQRTAELKAQGAELETRASGVQEDIVALEDTHCSVKDEVAVLKEQTLILADETRRAEELFEGTLEDDRCVLTELEEEEAELKAALGEVHASEQRRIEALREQLPQLYEQYISAGRG